MRQSQEGRALRQFTLSTGKSAGRNSSGRITVFHRGGGSKRLQRRNSEFMPRRSIWKGSFLDAFLLRMKKVIASLFLTHLLLNCGLTWVSVAPLLGLVEWSDWLLSSMDPLPVGGGGSDAGPSRRPELDLNQPPAPEQEPNPDLERKMEIKEELKKNVKRIRVFQGHLRFWEHLLEISLKKERESNERQRLHHMNMENAFRKCWNRRGRQ